MFGLGAYLLMMSLQQPKNYQSWESQNRWWVLGRRVWCRNQQPRQYNGRRRWGQRLYWWLHPGWLGLHPSRLFGHHFRPSQHVQHDLCKRLRHGCRFRWTAWPSVECRERWQRAGGGDGGFSVRRGLVFQHIQCHMHFMPGRKVLCDNWVNLFRFLPVLYCREIFLGWLHFLHAMFGRVVCFDSDDFCLHAFPPWIVRKHGRLQRFHRFYSLQTRLLLFVCWLDSLQDFSSRLLH